jgi:hypothetical protein
VHSHRFHENSIYYGDEKNHNSAIEPFASSGETKCLWLIIGNN